MSTTDKTESFYRRLREKLAQSADWPSTYMFKFILPSDAKKKSTLQAIFASDSVQFKERNSSKNTFVSITIQGLFDSPDEIISRYKQVAQIEGVIQL